MYSTFQTSSSSDVSTRNTATSSSIRSRPKRAQVQRACNACRLNRVKCDAQRPCRNCRERNRRCIDTPVEIRSLAAATEEIDRLRAEIDRQHERIRELEERSPGYESTTVTGATPQDGCAVSCALPRQWEGVYLSGVYHGPSSLTYYNHRMSVFLQPIMPAALNTVYLAPGTDTIPSLPAVDSSSISKAQQELCLDLYWHWYHPVYPVLIEDEFRNHFEALWTASDAISRASSPLVDIMIALSFQFCAACTVSSGEIEIQPQQANLYEPGLQYYRNCHLLLDTRADEYPLSIQVRCCVLSAVYLLSADLLVEAQTMVARAVRIATVLGYDHDVLRHEPEPQRESARRVWWTLYLLDSQLAMDTGRAFLMKTSMMSSCPRPLETSEVARQLGTHHSGEKYTEAHDGSGQYISWLSFQNQSLALVDLVRSMYEAFFARCDQVIASLGDFSSPTDLYSNDAAREQCARLLLDEMKRIDAWATEQVPAALQLRRQSGGPAFGIHRAAYVLDQSSAVPLWLQHQRVLLELQYHHLCALLCRSFICFFPHPAFRTPLSDTCAMAALNHAVAIVLLVRQCMAETDLLSGWHQASFVWLRSAGRIATGFSCAYPVCPITATARKASRMALRVFQEYGRAFRGAPGEIRCLKEQIEMSEMVLTRFKQALQLAAPTFVLPVKETVATPPVHPEVLGNMPSPKQTEVLSLWGDSLADLTGWTETMPESLWLNLEAAGIGEQWEWGLNGG